MSSALSKRSKDSLATRPGIQITHTRGGRESLAPVDINTQETTLRFCLSRPTIIRVDGIEAPRF